MPPTQVASMHDDIVADTELGDRRLVLEFEVGACLLNERSILHPPVGGGSKLCGRSGLAVSPGRQQERVDVLAPQVALLAHDEANAVPEVVEFQPRRG